MTTDMLNIQMSILMLQAVNCGYTREADKYQVADTNTMRMKYSNHAYSTSL